ncbi:hypothetical protein [Puniceicoccus vermicola]|uniref:PEP-CTERM sorting domain-containing protein n=1 Tax=Puniceicoccus vermicola TaxID=388746 RepID=A0A7X1AUF9_9BACT|nr:hypothetical protein [Puniceicoccus vermicola]MBC2600236.1 hypothetical protein [Puniceicoccus vermicola]
MKINKYLYLVPAFWISILTASAQSLYFNDFSVGDFNDFTSVSPSAENSDRGAVIINESSTPANPFSGNAMNIYDVDSGVGVYVQNDFTSSASSNLVQFMTFDAALSTNKGTSDGILSFRLTNEGISSSSKGNCAFDIQLRQNGQVSVYGDTSNGFSNRISTGGTQFSIYTNSGTSTVVLSDINGDDLTLSGSQFALYSGTEQLGIWGYLTDTIFDAADGIGRFGFLSASSNVGSDVIIDNISISAIPESASSALVSGIAAILMMIFNRRR